MGSLASEVLDEAHCFWATCAHPCCWESEQRIAKGVPHYIKQITSDGGRAPVDGRQSCIAIQFLSSLSNTHSSTAKCIEQLLSHMDHMSKWINSAVLAVQWKSFQPLVWLMYRSGLRAKRPRKGSCFTRRVARRILPQMPL